MTRLLFGLFFASFYGMVNPLTKYLKLVSFLVLIGGGGDLYAEQTGIYGSRKGYLESIEGERHREAKEIVLIDKPKNNELPLSDVIFTSKFTKEIRERYERKFGRTDIERNSLAPSRFVELEYFNGVRVTPEEDVRRKRIFGNYMIRKLFEYHLNEYFKSTPAIRPIYEVKEKISNLDVRIKGGYQLEVGYSYAGNHIKLKLKNPYKIRNRLILQMDSDGMGLGLEDAIFHLGYDITRKVGVNSYYATKKKGLKIIGYHKFSRSLTLSISGIFGVSTSFISTGLEKIDLDKDRGKFDNKILFGISWRG